MIIGIYGYQDSGKTKIVEQLVSALVKKGYRVASIKHTSGDWTLDQKGKDTWRHREAGSNPVVFSSASETSIMVQPSMDLDRITGLLSREFNPDIIIIEGYKKGRFPKVAMGEIKPLSGTVLRNPNPKTLLHYVEREVALEKINQILPGLDCGRCGLDCEGLARAVADGKKKLSECRELSGSDVRITVDGKRIATGRFVAEVAEKTIRGMVSSFKGYVPGKDVEIRLHVKKKSPKKVRRPR
ncbi:MAG: molybdopterin-guanine dinucleotide biosynthesis protein B [Euryarchaeota archaeon RBG_13_57_23]|nr:MAG: molybdopterin-guanine dinucleotide biosynthesis protein B [Euryarchaeota archaeon RBG_13_57_23]